MARILLTDDEDAVRGFVQRALEMDGHAVTQAFDGADALEKMEAAAEPFDLLLTDIRMPMMDGVALALASARDHPSTIILLMTGYADQRERAAGLEALIHDVVTKPFSLAQIRLAVADALGAREARICA